ncbi:hypothetical protein CNMCM8980_001520 [Aspergillus fumigatiaffinis]|nr:hypothetical protein CNMCM5878_003370 [Aspergillus fumigatiaffinis]KAF4221323.1 hypothetical protein CNMCM6457_001896 [Aspergillus fumigatiaffinis]KAF4239811.1 hypothetical protein CNMCM8980_001520 [Aspergillus fumigatiaffinis]
MLLGIMSWHCTAKHNPIRSRYVTAHVATFTRLLEKVGPQRLGPPRFEAISMLILEDFRELDSHALQHLFCLLVDLGQRQAVFAERS